MPVLEPNPQGGQKKLLQMLGVIAGIVVLIAIVATIAQNMG
ncbi:SGM_5486 family transporter-associated protein [Kitasatospora sp. NPDC092948]